MKLYEIKYRINFVDDEALSLYESKLREKHNRKDGQISLTYTNWHTSHMVGANLGNAITDLGRRVNYSYIEAARLSQTTFQSHKLVEIDVCKAQEVCAINEFPAAVELL
jgi:hypothetical protein